MSELAAMFIYAVFAALIGTVKGQTTWMVSQSYGEGDTNCSGPFNTTYYNAQTYFDNANQSRCSVARGGGMSSCVVVAGGLCTSNTYFNADCSGNPAQTTTPFPFNGQCSPGSQPSKMFCTATVPSTGIDLTCIITAGFGSALTNSCWWSCNAQIAYTKVTCSMLQAMVGASGCASSCSESTKASFQGYFGFDSGLGCSCYPASSGTTATTATTTTTTTTTPTSTSTTTTATTRADTAKISSSAFSFGPVFLQAVIGLVLQSMANF